MRLESSSGLHSGMSLQMSAHKRTLYRFSSPICRHLTIHLAVKHQRQWLLPFQDVMTSKTTHIVIIKIKEN